MRKTTSRRQYTHRRLSNELTLTDDEQHVDLAVHLARYLRQLTALEREQYMFRLVVRVTARVFAAIRNTLAEVLDTEFPYLPLLGVKARTKAPSFTMRVPGAHEQPELLDIDCGSSPPCYR